ncbi:hypothetical protein CRYUN_Cryun01aG0018800 [Craigia yunnanensis]
MKSVKGKLLKKLKSIKPVDYLKPDRVLQVFSIDGFIDSCPKTPNSNEQPKLLCKESEQVRINESCVTVEEQSGIIDVAELMKDLEADDDDEEMDLNDEVEDKENIKPTMKENIDVVVEKENVNMNMNVPMKLETGKCRQNAPLSEIDVPSFRKPDLNSCTLFDPNLLAAFELAVKVHIKMSEEEREARIEQENLVKSREGAEKKARIEISLEKSENEPPYKTRRIDDNVDVDDDGDPLLGYEEKCPPGGDGSVIFYTTALKGIRKTFEDCNSVRFLLESFQGDILVELKRFLLCMSKGSLRCSSMAFLLIDPMPLVKAVLELGLCFVSSAMAIIESLPMMGCGVNACSAMRMV